MAVLSYEDLRFKERDGRIEACFMDRFFFDIGRPELEGIGRFRSAAGNEIEFDGKEAKIRRLFDRLLSRKIETSLRARDGRKAVYVHKGPLIGAQAFGILDSDTNCIEVRPVTGCNLNCIFCSVDEKLKKGLSYAVDPELLVSGLKKIAQKKKHPLYVHISALGEPLLYSRIVELVKDISGIEKVKRISIGTNGTLLTEELVDALKQAGLDRINLSLNAVDPDAAKKLAGSKEYDVDRIIGIARYIKSSGLGLVIAPVFLQGLNEGEIGKIIELAKELGCKAGIQNFLEYSRGRVPAEQLGWDEFYSRLEELEKKHGMKLIDPDLGFDIRKDRVLEKPFRKGQVVSAENIYPGYAAAGNRLIAVQGNGRAGKPGQKIKLKLIRDKHNIYAGVPA